MNTVLLDEKLAEQLEQATTRVAIKNRKGRIVGYYEPVSIAPPGVARKLSPNSDDDLRRLVREKTGGLPLADVLRRIGAE